LTSVSRRSKITRMPAKHKRSQGHLRSLDERKMLANRTFDEIVRPIREDVRKSGVTESQLEQIVIRARRATGRRAKKRRR
jgi:hypothetical protein